MNVIIDDINKLYNRKTIIEQLINKLGNDQPNNDTKLHNAQRYIFEKVLSNKIDCSYSFNLKELQDNIFEKYTQHVKNLPTLPNPSAIMLFGSLGAGKSYCIKELFKKNNDTITGKNLNGNADQYVYIDMDEIRMQVPKYRKMINGTWDKTYGSEVDWIWSSSNGNLLSTHYNVEKGRGVSKIDSNGQNIMQFKAIENIMNDNNCKFISSDIAYYPNASSNTILGKCINNKYNIIYDGSCENWPNCVSNILIPLKNAGYNILIVGVISNIKKSIKNAKDREKLNGRYTDKAYLETVWEKINNNFTKIQEDAKSNGMSLVIIDNTNYECKI